MVMLFFVPLWPKFREPDEGRGQVAGCAEAMRMLGWSVG